MKKPKEKPLKILFVCYGNTCRSPMAEGLGKHWLKGLAEVESAGLHAAFTQGASEAVELLKRYYQVDISSHRPRSVRQVDFDEFDLVVALDETVARVLKEDYAVLEEKLEFWSIPDPIGGTINDYERSLNKIEKNLLDLKKRLEDFSSD